MFLGALAFLAIFIVSQSDSQSNFEIKPKDEFFDFSRFNHNHLMAKVQFDQGLS